MMAEAVNVFQKHRGREYAFPYPPDDRRGGSARTHGPRLHRFPTGLGLGATWNPELVEKAAEVIGFEGAAAGIHTVYGPILDLPQDPRWSRAEEDFSEDPVLTSALGVAYVKGLQEANSPSAAESSPRSSTWPRTAVRPEATTNGPRISARSSSETSSSGPSRIA
jgi:hypothetical protein